LIHYLQPGMRLIAVNEIEKGVFSMAICHEMKPGDVYFCAKCGLELKVEKTCGCQPGKDECSVPLQCCGQDMAKK